MILLVGTADEYLVTVAKTFSADAVLITKDNYQLVSNNGVGYTGIEEFDDCILFLNTILSAEQVHYYPSPKSVKFDMSEPTSSGRGHTEYLLLLINQSTPVVNINLISGIDKVNETLSSFLDLSDVRKTNQPQIWSAGCSFTYGIGVKQEERYINLISIKLNIPSSCLAVSAGSISWAADQILRSDIKKDDIIVWGLTIKTRHPWYYNNKLWHVNVNSYDINDYKWVESEYPQKVLINEPNSIYQFLTHIHQVINFCDKIGAKILLVGLLTSPSDVLYLHNLPNFYQYYNKNSNDYIDRGHDNIHPGPLQHQLYADAIIEQLQKRKWV